MHTGATWRRMAQGSEMETDGPDVPIIGGGFGGLYTLEACRSTCLHLTPANLAHPTIFPAGPGRSARSSEPYLTGWAWDGSAGLLMCVGHPACAKVVCQNS